MNLIGYAYQVDAAELDAEPENHVEPSAHL